ncbi:MAG: virulence factor SrfC family protein, partial [Bacteroidota bacterium]
MSGNNASLKEKFNENAHAISKFITNSKKWARTKPKHLSNIDVSIRRLNKYGREVNKVLPDLETKPALALFGASQSGKSNMVTNLLKSSDNKFVVYDAKRDRTLDFAEFIRPPGGGQESTANLTRFVKHDKDSNRGARPVLIKLCSIKDLLISIMVGYYQYQTIDVNEAERSLVLIRKKIEELRNVSGDRPRNNWLTSEDVYNIRDFFSLRNIDRNLLLFENLKNENFWDHLSIAAEYLTNDDLGIFSVFWNDFNPITTFFKTYFKALQKLDFAHEIYVDFDAVLKDCPEHLSFENYYNILYVETLKGSNTKDKDVIVVDHNGMEVELHPSTLCGLVKEVVFSIKSNEDSIANEFDILDFPGENTAPDVPIDNNSDHTVLCKMLLRGKVTYMFNSYSK